MLQIAFFSIYAFNATIASKLEDKPPSLWTSYELEDTVILSSSDRCPRASSGGSHSQVQASTESKVITFDLLEQNDDNISYAVYKGETYHKPKCYDEKEVRGGVRISRF